MVKSWKDASVLIAGCGSIGKRHARVLSGLGVRDLRACDPNPAQRESLTLQASGIRHYDSYKAGLADRPDAVFICTPPEMHIPMALEAIRAGSHVFCEKPLSNRPDGIDELSALAAERRAKVMVRLCFRFHEGLVQAKRLVDQGRVGRLVSLRALMGEHLPEVRPDFRTLFTSRSSGAFDLTHEVDLALWFAARPVRRIQCLSGTFSDIGIRAPDLVEILIEFEDRCAASIHLDFFQRPRRRQFELIGTEGVITVEFARWEVCTLSVYEVATRSWRVDEIATDRDDMFRAQDREFLEAVFRDGPVSCTIEEARKSVDVVATAQGDRQEG